MKIFNQTFFKPNALDKCVPYQSTPKVCYLEKFLQPQVAVRRKVGLFSGLKEAFQSAKEAVVSGAKKVAEAVKTGAQATFETAKIATGAVVTNSTTTQSDVIESIINLKELKETRKNYEELCERYTRLFGTKPDVMTTLKVKFATLTQLKTCIATITPIVEREEMMVDLEHTFKKGAASYLPHIYAEPFNVRELKEIRKPDKIKSYKKELAGMAQTFMENSCKVEDGMEVFNKLSKNYFTQAAKSVKEIYDIKSDGANQLLERIPKLGIIPKTLRVKEQTRLTRCVLGDFKDISDKYVAKGLKPYLQKYNKQYGQIQEFVDEHWFRAFFYRRYTKRIMQKVDEVRIHRLKSQATLLNAFAANGANLSKMCKSIEHSGKVEIAKKALFMLIPYL